MRLYIVTDDLGSFPMLWEERLPPRGSSRLHLTWHFVTEVDSLDEAYAALDRLGLPPGGRCLRRHGTSAGEAVPARAASEPLAAGRRHVHPQREHR